MKLTLEDIQYVINESVKKILTEDVFTDISKMNHKTKKIGLTYSKGKGNNKGNYRSFDMLKTDRMDEDNSNVYLVPLKGGVMSYNITDIKGTEVMHYFKRLWDNQKTYVKVGDRNNTEDYEITMLEQEKNEFMERFVRKIELVTSDFINKNIKDSSLIRGISIFPLKSSSNFNKKMAEEMVDMNVNGLPIQIINENLLIKDLRNLERDDDFIKKNQSFYDSSYTQTGDMGFGSVDQQLNKNINKFTSLKQSWELLPEINQYSKELIRLYYVSNQRELSPKVLNKMADVYRKYYDTLAKCVGVKYYDVVSNSEKGFHADKVIVKIKYSKGPSIEKRSAEIWEMVKPFMRSQKSPITGKAYLQTEICLWNSKSFEIKKLPNSIRMGLKNIYNPNTDTNLVNAEIAKTKGTLFIIFDDNISGGATLSDVCYQCKQMGIENILPITFGKMHETNNMGIIPLSTPKNGYNLS